MNTEYQAPQSVQEPPQNPPTPSPEEREHRETWHGIKIYAFAAAMLLAAVVGLLFFLRPSVSESEKRELTKFPTLTWESLSSGEYFAKITTWYADTYPGREGLIHVNQWIHSLFGIRTVQIIPSLPEDPTTPEDPSSPGTSEDSPVDTTPIEKLGSVYVKGSTAYELYKENAANSARYAELISQAATLLQGSAKVYDIIVPLSSSVNLSQKELGRVGSSDAAAAILSMYSKMEGVHTVDIYETLRAHNSEYLYFRTDHHWTALGGYYAYVEFCHAAGMTPYPLSTWQEYQFEGFLGTLYAEAGSPPQLGNTPDTVHAWVPNGTNDIRITDKTGNTLRYRGGVVRTDTDTFYANAASKYNCFIMGDNPLSEIHNEKITDGSSIVVVKESFGNALIPFLVDHYEYVYVIDYRSFPSATGKTLSQFVQEKKIPTVLFINNLTATSATPRLNELSKLLAG